MLDTRELTAFADDGTRIVSPTFSLAFFTNEVFTRIPEAVLSLYRRFLELAGRENLKFYANDSMRTSRGVTPRTFNLLEGWVRVIQGKKRQMIRLRLSDGVTYADTPDHCVIFCGVEEGMTGHGRDANLARLALPLATVFEDSGTIFNTIVELAELFPLQSGIAGGHLERSDYHQAEADPTVWRIGMETPGFDISRETQDRLAVGHNGIKGVNWVTIISDDFIQRLGGNEAVLAALSSVYEVRWTSKGDLIIRASEHPLLCRDPAEFRVYSDVFNVLRPLVIPSLDRFGAFSLPGDRIDRSDAWFMRLGRGDA